ncbi:MAG: hypothetical protein KY475_17745 [Planctomycetes bacterium]|nr:hypothetical protein [Planctomycetota bacterium]
MSGSPIHEPLTGLILQGDRIVGGVKLPNPPEAFIHEFNRLYERAGLRVVRNSRPQSEGFSSNVRASFEVGPDRFSSAQ